MGTDRISLGLGGLEALVDHAISSPQQASATI
jgi:hypothetical protein